MKKFLCLIVVISTTMCLFAGCKKPKNPTELHYWDTSEYRKDTPIIYEVRSVPSEIIDGNLYWDKDNVQIEFYFGWDENKKPNFQVKDEICELVCYAAYFYWPEDESSSSPIFYDDYKNPTDALFLKEISIEEISSDKYKTNYGKKSGLLGRNPPVYNKSNEPLIITLSQEVFDISEEKRLFNETTFKFVVTPIYRYFSEEYPGYALYFGLQYDGVRFIYSMYPETDKIHIYCRP